ncbi:MAG: oxidoreductase [Acidobacteria bacterium]|nr:oxidoreductase [Acidobacteriota bacterium]
MLMKRLILLSAAALAIAGSALAADDVPAPKVDEKVDQIIRRALPVCADTKITHSAVDQKLPDNLNATYVRTESSVASCNGQYISVVTKAGDYFLGLPWFVGRAEGATIEERISAFGWNAMHEHFQVNVDRDHPTRNGLYEVTLEQTTEHGKMPIEGEVDPKGDVFFLGHFHPMSEDVRVSREKAFEPFLATAPSEGAAKPEVTVIEFSDFECPSCQHASAYLDPIVKKYGDKVRYVRFDLPLISNHPWAFAAAVAGRAIYRQKPELFWEYKKQVYANQEQLSSFTIDDFARNFAKDRELDLARYDADLASPAIQADILKGIGAAFSNDIRATPSYVVNGMLVEPGKDGVDLEAYVVGLLKK